MNHLTQLRMPESSNNEQVDSFSASDSDSVSDSDEEVDTYQTGKSKLEHLQVGWQISCRQEWQGMCSGRNNRCNLAC